VTSFAQVALSPRTSRVIVEVGTNDALRDHSRSAEERDYRALISTIERAQPSATVVFLSVPPSRGYRAQAAQVNAALATVCRESGARRVDLGPLIASTGEIDQRYTIDGVHLNGYGWAASRRSCAAQRASCVIELFVDPSDPAGRTRPGAALGAGIRATAARTTQLPDCVILCDLHWICPQGIGSRLATEILSASAHRA
jgi:hypothetical protein